MAMWVNLDKPSHGAHSAPPAARLSASALLCEEPIAQQLVKYTHSTGKHQHEGENVNACD